MYCASIADALTVPGNALGAQDHLLPDLEPARDTQPSIIVVGLGNPILGDDGVGWRVAEQVQAMLQQAGDGAQRIEVICFALGGLSLMERLIGFEHAIIIDAMQTNTRPPGGLHNLTLAELPELAAGHLTAAHDTSLMTAMHLGRKMGAPLPEAVTIIGIEAAKVYDFSEELSPEVAAAVPQAVQLVLRTLAELPLEPIS